MRIGIINTQAPFITGGAERHAANLCKALRERGFDATEISMPFKSYPAKTLVDHILAAKLLDLGEVEGTPVDLAIGLKFPAYLARHPNKVYWVLHQHRQAYDLWQSELTDLHHDPDGMAARALIHEEDRRALGAPDAKVYANSRNVSKRLERHLGLPSRPLYHPPPQAEAMRQGPYGDYLFAPSRMNGSKRQMLMLDALARSRSGARLVFAGPADRESFMDDFRARARTLGVEDRITCLGAVDDGTILRCYAECRGVVFIPVDEDYGYITLEAMLSGKPVITALDSGGPLEFVDDGVEGLVVAAQAEEIGAAFDRLMSDAALAERMGQAARARYDAMAIGWDTVVAALTDGATTGIDPLGADPAAVLRHPCRGLEGAAPASAGTDSEAPPPAPMPPDAKGPDALKAMVAPPPGPDALPFADAKALLATYDLGPFGADLPREGTLEARWPLYRAMLALALEDRTDRVLEIWPSPPFALQAMLAAARPGTRVDGIGRGLRPFVRTAGSLREGLPDLDVSVTPADIERDPLPSENGLYDLVLGGEVLHRLAVDPLFFMAEAARVLRPGGRILLATPNVTGHRGMRRMLDGDAPYRSGAFVPTGGVHGRHNREYAPREVAALGEAAGFVTERLLTADLHDEPLDPEVAALLTERGSVALRGETILYVGRLEAHRPARRPEGLYRGDPRQLSGRLRLLDRDPATGSTRIGVENRSPAVWHARGEGRIGLRLDWADGRGTLAHIGGYRAFPAALDRGQSTEITLPLDPGPPDAAGGTIIVALFQAGAGTMEKAGRANALSVPCSEAAFLRLLRGSA